MALSAPHRIVHGSARDGGRRRGDSGSSAEPAPPAGDAEAGGGIPEPAMRPLTAADRGAGGASGGRAVKPVAEEAAEREEAVAVPSLPEPDPGACWRTKRRRSRCPQPRSPDSRLPRRRRNLSRRDRPFGRVPRPADDPLVLAGLVVALVLLLALVVLRRRGAERDEEPITPFDAGEPFSVDEQPESRTGERGASPRRSGRSKPGVLALRSARRDSAAVGRRAGRSSGRG